VLADLQRSSPIDLRAGYDDAAGQLWISEAGEFGMWGYEPWDERGAGLLVDLADCLQEQFFPETRGAWGQARPCCPGHPHPAQAVRLGDEAWWICPVDQIRIGRIGELEVL
jgi:hypothetical protein